MAQVMMDKTCRDFAEALAAREPVPGGGGASAYVVPAILDLPRLRITFALLSQLRVVLALSCLSWWKKMCEPTVLSLRHMEWSETTRIAPRRFRMLSTRPPCRLIALWSPVRVCLPCLRKWPIRAPVNFFQTLPAALAGRKSNAFCEHHVHEGSRACRGTRARVRRIAQYLVAAGGRSCQTRG